MNWKYIIGKSFSELEKYALGSNSNFIKNNYPYGRNWIFDLKRSMENKVLNIVDAGANVGSVSKDLAIHFPDAKIYSFEPVAGTYNILKKSVLASKNIYPIKCALGEKEEKLQITLNSEHTINSLKANDWREGTVKEEIEVIRLENFMISKEIKKIDILKIDVEGFEFDVLKGCGLLLKKITCIFLEVGYQREPTKVHFSDVDIFMEENGFEIYGVYDIMPNLGDKKRISYSNNLYIKKDHFVKS